MAEQTTASTTDGLTTTSGAARRRHSWRVVKLPTCELCLREAELHGSDPRLPLLQMALCRACVDRVAYMAGWLPKGAHLTRWSRNGVTVLVPFRPWPRRAREARPGRRAA